jgi:parallel beta-helix repeat protein
VRKLVLAAVTATLFACLSSVAYGHTTAPTGLVVTGTTETSISLDWTQDYADAYSGYYVRVDGGARVKYPHSVGTVSNLKAGTTYRICVSIDFTSSTHPDESEQTCISATTKGTAPAPAPSPAPSPSPSPSPDPAPAPAPAPAPSTSACTKTLAAGGDLSTFLSTLRSGDVGCLRGGDYTDGCAVSWGLDATSTSRAVLQSTPGELAVLHTSLGLAGDNLTASGLRITGIAASCGSDMSGFTVQGANDTIQYSSVYDVTRHGILTNTTSSNTTIHGNRIESVGSECNLDHGIYFQRSGRITRNVFVDTRCGYGIHLYSAPSNVTVADNVSVGSRVRAGILVNCGTNCRIVNNIFANNKGSGIAFRACASGCVVDNNITWNIGGGSVRDSLASKATGTRNVDPRFSDTQYRVTSTSPAVDTGRSEFSFFPAWDGIANMLGAGPDVGAYER